MSVAIVLREYCEGAARVFGECWEGVKRMHKNAYPSRTQQYRHIHYAHPSLKLAEQRSQILADMHSSLKTVLDSCIT